MLHVPQQVVQDASGCGCQLRVLSTSVGIQIRGRQLGVVVQHLLKVGDVQLGVCGMQLRCESR